MSLTFEWDEEKAASNFEKHGISFQAASTVFKDSLSLTISNPRHSFEEQRFVTIGEAVGQEILVVAPTQRDARVRIISAREATRKERRDYAGR